MYRSTYPLNGSRRYHLFFGDYGSFDPFTPQTDQGYNPGMPIDLHEILDGKWEDGTRPKDLYAEHVSKRPRAYVKQLIAGLDAGNRRIENGCAELTSLLSEDKPELLYPFVDVFVTNLESKEKVIRWEAVCTLGNLASVDEQGVIPKQLPTLIGALTASSIVLQGHAGRALAKVAIAQPQTANRIFEALTGAADSFPGNKIGFVIEAVGELAAINGFENKIRAFVAPYLESDVNVVVKKAGRVLKKLEA